MSALADRIRAYAAEHPEAHRRDIAAACGCSQSTVWRSLNPEEHRQRERERNDYKRLWNRQHGHGVCADCGGLTTRPDRATRCMECRRANDAARVQARGETVQRMWRAGASLREIANAIGVNEEAMGVTMTRLRDAGWDLPYRRRPSQPKHRRLLGA